MSDTPTPNFGELGQVSFTVSDIDRAIVFLRDKVGLPFLFQVGPGGLAFFMLGSVRLMVTKPEGKNATVANSTLYLKVADIDASVAELTARGVVLKTSPISSPKCRITNCGWRSFAIPTAACSA